MEGATNDEDKCGRVLQALGVPEVPVTLQRLGTEVQGRQRPILARTPNKRARDFVLQNTRALKDAGPTYMRVYVKKDIHPAIRREWKRLKVRA